MENRLLHAVRLTLNAPQQIARALRDARLLSERAQECAAVMFVCDLRDAPAQTMPEDADLVRCAQSLIMSMNARRPGRFLFVIRKRRRDEAMDAWLGEHQTPGARETLASLLRGDAAGPFEASNVAPGSLKDAFDAVLITHAEIAMLPDAPAQMMRALKACDLPALRGDMRLPERRDEPVFHRLLRAGFSLTPPGLDLHPDEPLAAIYRADALDGPPPGDAADVPFLLRHAPTLEDCFAHFARRADAGRLISLLRLGALFAAAFWGWSWLALAAVLAPELLARPRLRRLPGALLRLAFLPRLALMDANALLRERLSRKEYRLLLSDRMGTCPVFGAALFLLALRSGGALAELFPVSLLWASAPTLARALTLPTRERIPLDDAERLQLKTLTKAAFSALSPDAASPAHLFCACAGCMLGYLEPDEAARRAQAMLPRLAMQSAFDRACVLASAQFFTERMADCDAALRALPAQLEAIAEAAPTIDAPGPLGALLRAATENPPGEEAIRALQRADAGDAADALFLPRRWRTAGEAIQPLTHPHTYLKRARMLSADNKKEKSDALSPLGEANRFLVLACAALDSPFDALLLRSARVEPFASILDFA